MKPKIEVLVEVMQAGPVKVSKAGNNYQMQDMYVHLGGPHPERIEQYRGNPSECISPGKYIANSLSIYDGRLTVNLRSLEPVK